MIVSFDIDGTLTSYPGVWLTYIAMETGKTYGSVLDAKSDLGEEYSRIKHRYRESDYKYSVPILDEACKVITALNEQGHAVYCSTSRPLSNYPKMKRRTMEWLESQGVRVVDIVQKTSEKLLGMRCDFHVDDELEEVRALEAAGIRCVFYCKNGTADRLSRHHEVVRCLTDVLDVVR